MGIKGEPPELTSAHGGFLCFSAHDQSTGEDLVVKSEHFPIHPF
jgi:hypothetical protein